MSKTDMYGEETNEHIRHLHVADNIKILRNMKSESIDLIYLDPPFNSKKQWENAVKVKPGAKMKIAFKDAWHAGDIHTEDALELRQQCPEVLSIIQALSIVNGSGWEAYLIYMAARLIEMRRVLKETGSIYLHCDPVMSHGLKLLLDAIFGKSAFRNEIIWQYSTGGVGKKHFARKHDVILFYAKGNKFYLPRTPSKDEKRFNLTDVDGRKYYTKAGIDYYADNGVAMTDVWDIPTVRNVSKEYRGYPTQKPLTLLERIIEASSNEGDIVLDPFCGCATACVAAERLGRQWIGIDIAGVDDRIKNTDKSYAIEDLLFDRIESDCGDGSLFSARQTYKLNPQGKLYKRDDLPSYNRSTLAANLYAQNKQCQMCNDEKQIHDMEIDHILPKARGGQDEYRNLQLICSKCNGEKGSKTMSRWRQEAAQRKAQSLFAEDAEKRRKEMEDKMAFGFDKKTTKNK